MTGLQVNIIRNTNIVLETMQKAIMAQVENTKASFKVPVMRR
jgi:hypothetical protein